MKTLVQSLVAGVLILPIAGCTSAGDPEPDRPADAVDAVTSGAPAPADSLSCVSAGGTWGRFGLMGTDLCNMPTADAGAACRDHDDCESLCVTDNETPRGTPTKGMCYERSVELGTCLNQVQDGTAQGVICID